MPEKQHVDPRAEPARAKSRIISTGSRDLCLKLERYRRASTFQTRRLPAAFGTTPIAARESGFFERNRQKRYGRSFSFSRSPCVARKRRPPASKSSSSQTRSNASLDVATAQKEVPVALDVGHRDAAGRSPRALSRKRAIAGVSNFGWAMKKWKMSPSNVMASAPRERARSRGPRETALRRPDGGRRGNPRRRRASPEAYRESRNLRPSGCCLRYDLSLRADKRDERQDLFTPAPRSVDPRVPGRRSPRAAVRVVSPDEAPRADASVLARSDAARRRQRSRRRSRRDALAARLLAAHPDPAGEPERRLRRLAAQDALARSSRRACRSAPLRELLDPGAAAPTGEPFSRSRTAATSRGSRSTRSASSSRPAPQTAQQLIRSDQANAIGVDRCGPVDRRARHRRRLHACRSSAAARFRTRR